MRTSKEDYSEKWCGVTEEKMGKPEDFWEFRSKVGDGGALRWSSMDISHPVGDRCAEENGHRKEV